MFFSNGIAIISNALTSVVCTALALLILFQLSHDSKSSSLAQLLLLLAAIGFFNVMMRFIALSNGSIDVVMLILVTFAVLLPYCLFRFVNAYFDLTEQVWRNRFKWAYFILMIVVGVAALIGIFFKLPTIFSAPHIAADGEVLYGYGILWPLDFFGIAVAEFCVLLTVYTVIQQYRKQRGWPNNRVALGVILLAIGMIQLPIPHIEQYAFEQIFYAVGSIVLVGPVLQQRLFDPISQLNISLKRRADQLALITRVGQQINSVLTLPNLLDDIAQEIQRAFSYHCVTIYMPDDENQLQVQAVAADTTDSKMDIQDKQNGGVLTATAQATLTYVPDVWKNRQDLPYGLRPETRSFVSIPLFISTPDTENTFIGVLGIEHQRVNAFNAEDLEALQILSRQIAAAIQNAQLFEAVQSANDAKTKFIGYIGHEVRNPIGIILSITQMIVEHPNMLPVPLPDLYQQDMVRLNTQAMHLKNLLIDLLDMTKIEAGKLELVLEPVDPLPILEQVEQAVIAQLPPAVEFRRCYVLPFPSICADKTRFTQILINIVGNAIKFTEQGSITLGVNVEPERLCFSVADTGRGMSSETLKRLFQPFNQGSEDTARPLGGTGLGLSISKQLVELHSGEIWVKSQPGQGTTFFFTMPIVKNP